MSVRDLAVRPVGGVDDRGARLVREAEQAERSRLRAAGRAITAGRLAFAAAALLGWELSSGRIVDQFFVSKPTHIAASLWAMLVREQLLYHLQFTVVEALAGYVLGAAAGLVLGFVLARSDLVYRIVEPFLVAFYGIPRIALAPLFILWFGIGIASKIAVAAVMVFFIVFINTIAGIRAAPPQLLQVARVMGASQWDLTRKVVFPAATPFVVAALQITVPQAMIGAIVGEFISSNRGVGHLISRAAGWLDTPGLFAGIVALLAVVLLMNLGITALGNHLMRWSPRHGSLRDIP
ncbi:MAG: ABC transporter permease [Armatimonadota bacterium]|nr:ABC transporter permease [Armatimonadota bacterium]MDR7436128.1 ABC transporter permease [Armatimonadota bacterium]MDR7472007.1 ABC transporter permease [Armatimonadota bacterium]MDR7506709.1 ABC transporter permease [Armatimonadota bacterium]MDR7508663.1 ABC transporter permease [Armatimonadota bacterium]